MEKNKKNNRERDVYVTASVGHGTSTVVWIIRLALLLIAGLFLLRLISDMTN